MTKYQLGIWDYVVIAVTLVVSVGIGVKFRFSGGRQKTADEYLLAGKDMSMLPVIMSFTVTCMSAISMMGGSAEVYRYGAGVLLDVVWISLGIVFVVYKILPIYFRQGVTSVNEFLETRYGKITKYTVSALSIIDMILYMSVVLYGPALALSAITDFSMETSIVVFAVACTFYCSIGGLKAVLWTDVFQAVLMYSCLVIVLVTAIVEAGGLSEVLTKAHHGHRLNVFNFTFDLTERQTFWNVMSMCLVYSVGFFGTNQLQMQRLLSLSTLERAKSAALWSIIPLVIITFMCNFLGVVLYAVFYECDPVLDSAETGITRYDQLVPFFVVSRLGWAPLVSGICVSGIFSGSLSTISSALNSLATLTLCDFLQPALNLPEKRQVLVAKGLVLFYGGLCLSLAFAVSKLDGILFMTTVFGSLIGPRCALFVVGIFYKRPGEKNALFSLALGCAVLSWMVIGTMVSGRTYPSLEMDSSQCGTAVNRTHLTNLTYSSHLNCSQSDFADTGSEENQIFFLYRTSFLWFITIGFIVTAFCMFMISSIASLLERANVIDSTRATKSYRGGHENNEGLEAERIQLTAVENNLQKNIIIEPLQC